MADLTAADPVAETLAALRGDPALTAAFGGPEHVSGLYEAPWPRLRVTMGPGSNVDEALWLNTVEVTLEVVDHPANPLGQAALWRLAMRVLIAVKTIPERDVAPGEAVVTAVRHSGSFAWAPLQTGQGRYSMGVSVTVHPPLG